MPPLTRSPPRFWVTFYLRQPLVLGNGFVEAMRISTWISRRLCRLISRRCFLGLQDLKLAGSEYGGRHGAWLGPLHQVAVGLAVPVGDEPRPRPGDSVRCVSTRRTAHHVPEFLCDFWWTPSLMVYLWYIATMSWLPDTSWTEPSPPGAIRTPSGTFCPSGIWWASCR